MHEAAAILRDVGVQDLWDAEPGYFNTASYGLPPRAAFEALQSALADWRGGRTSWEGWNEHAPAARELFARLVGVPAADVAIGATVSELIGLVAAALPAGARVLVPEGEYTSNLFPWLVHADRGVEVVSVPLARLAEAIDARTTLVASASSAPRRASSRRSTRSSPPRATTTRSWRSTGRRRAAGCPSTPRASTRWLSTPTSG